MGFNGITVVSGVDAARPPPNVRVRRVWYCPSGKRGDGASAPIHALCISVVTPCKPSSPIRSFDSCLQWSSLVRSSRRVDWQCRGMLDEIADILSALAVKASCTGVVFDVGESDDTRLGGCEGCEMPSMRAGTCCVVATSVGDEGVVPGVGNLTSCIAIAAVSVVVGIEVVDMAAWLPSSSIITEATGLLSSSWCLPL